MPLGPRELRLASIALILDGHWATKSMRTRLGATRGLQGGSVQLHAGGLDDGALTGALCAGQLFKSFWRSGLSLEPKLGEQTHEMQWLHRCLAATRMRGACQSSEKFSMVVSLVGVARQAPDHACEGATLWGASSVIAVSEVRRGFSI